MKFVDDDDDDDLVSECDGDTGSNVYGVIMAYPLLPKWLFKGLQYWFNATFSINNVLNVSLNHSSHH